MKFYAFHHSILI
ncbi:hypothetical protein Pint_04315 [Pistacia integerrima]|uniref:Uncharacterized protein n=1 Tax=Pistacia integerrima TaxID=434235 RepID=A0ACC0Z2D0_9ROSI|nr:hypothetical protein Pint_04315 [Pistacia integerrima]